MPAEAPDVPPLCLPPAAPRPRPGFRLPEGTCDTHIHVFGPAARYPLAAKRDYTPVEATLADYAGLMDAYGIGRAVLVQPSVYGTDNSLVLDTLARDPERLRAVAVIPPISPRSASATSTAPACAACASIAAIRAACRSPPSTTSPAASPGSAGTSSSMSMSARRPSSSPWRNAAAVPLVIDHFGLASPAAGPDDPAVVNLLRLVERGAYVKLSAPYRIPPAGAPLASFRSLVERLAALRPDRLLWGTDWPHVACWPAMPDDGDLAAATEDWLPTPALRRRGARRQSRPPLLGRG